jgi:hypothetical protein
MMTASFMFFRGAGASVGPFHSVGATEASSTVFWKLDRSWVLAAPLGELCAGEPHPVIAAAATSVARTAGSNPGLVDRLMVIGAP